MAKKTKKVRKNVVRGIIHDVAWINWGTVVPTALAIGSGSSRAGRIVLRFEDYRHGAAGRRALERE